MTLGVSEWKLKVICGVHNLPTAEYIEDHSYVRRLLECEISILIEISMYYVRPRNILTLLKQKNLKNISTIKTIYYTRHKHKLIEQGAATE